MASATPSARLEGPMVQLREGARAFRSSGALAMRTAEPAMSSMETSFQLSPMARMPAASIPRAAARREQGRALGAAGGEDVEDGEVAVGVFGAVEGELVLRFGRIASHPSR